MAGQGYLVLEKRSGVNLSVSHDKAMAHERVLRAHHIRFHYACFDGMLRNGLIQPFQQPERVIGFFNTYRHPFPVSRKVLTEIADQFHGWVKNRSEIWHAPIMEAPEGRRDEFVEPYFHQAKPDQIVAIVKAREPARIMVAIGNNKENRWHVQIAQRWVVPYNFYVNDAHGGKMFVRMCPYLPFSARVCLNQHHWLANPLNKEGMVFTKCSNAFLKCSNFKRLQQLADSLTAQDLLACGQKWLAAFTPFFTPQEGKHSGCQHRRFFTQIEYCHNLIFSRRTALDELGNRLLDANRTLGCPDKITLIFGRKVTSRYRGKLQTEIEDMHLPNPVIRSHYGHGFIQQYVREHRILRTEAATNHVNDYGVKKAVENLPPLRERLSAINENYLNVQQDILETFLDGGQLRKLTEPTRLANGRRLPGLRLDHPRLLALMHALVRFPHIAAGSIFTTAELHPFVADPLACTPADYTLASLRYDLSKLRANNLVEKLPHSREYCLLACSYSVCLLFLKLFERIYAPLTAGLFCPFRGDPTLQHEKRSQLDRLYQRVLDDLNQLVRAVGIASAKAA